MDNGYQIENCKLTTRFTADMARDLSDRSYPDEYVDNLLMCVHMDIEKAARDGRRHAHLWCYNPVESALNMAVLERLCDEGYTIKVFSEDFGPMAKYVCW